jgi:hypothetical protein
VRSRGPVIDQMKEDEKKVELFLRDRGLEVQKFLKSDLRAGKTPDFKVLDRKSGKLLFYCEVKSIGKDNWLDEKIAEVPSGQIAGGLRNDPIFNRLTTDIYQSIKQFDTVNPDISISNVLVFVNHDDFCGFLDLIGVLTGNAMTENSGAMPIYRLYSEGRIKEKKSRIHLFIWLDDFRPDRLLFNQTDENHHKLLCDVMNMDPSSLKIIPES